MLTRKTKTNKNTSRKRNASRCCVAEVFESRTLLSGISANVLDVSMPTESTNTVDNRQNNESSQEQSDVVLDWNNIFNDVLVADEANQNPGYASRSMAMLNVAIYDAVALASGNGNDTFYEYDADIVGRGRISAESAASEAAYTVLSSLYPDQQELIDEQRDSIVRGLDRNRATFDGMTLGEAIGTQVIDARANDGSTAEVEYKYNEGVGWFQADPLNPDVPVWGPGWGEVDPFAITAPEDFAPETTPPLNSPEYAASYNEVLELGSVDSETRTADQTEAGIFWAYDRTGLGTPLSLYNDVIETVAVQQGNSLEENAALFAQTSVAMADAAIVAWHTKFDEQFWRPVTAIHQGDVDDNPLTEGDETWTALGAPDGEGDIIGFTPQFPTYISGHATFGGALFGSLQEFYGTDDISFELSSNELEILMDDPELMAEYGLDLDDSVRSFDTLSEAMAENGRSRVYLGIHFDFDDTVGQDVGQAVAGTVASEFGIADNDGGGRGGRGGQNGNNGGGRNNNGGNRGDGGSRNDGRGTNAGGNEDGRRGVESNENGNTLSDENRQEDPASPTTPPVRQTPPTVQTDVAPPPTAMPVDDVGTEVTNENESGGSESQETNEETTPRRRRRGGESAAEDLDDVFSNDLPGLVSARRR